MISAHPDIACLVARIEPDIVTWRRHLHAQPELSFKEFETSRFVAERLRSFGGIEVSLVRPRRLRRRRQRRRGGSRRRRRDPRRTRYRRASGCTPDHAAETTSPTSPGDATASQRRARAVEQRRDGPQEHADSSAQSCLVEREPRMVMLEGRPRRSRFACRRRRRRPGCAGGRLLVSCRGDLLVGCLKGSPIGVRPAPEENHLPRTLDHSFRAAVARAAQG
jgi:hypothetical protein